MTITEKFMTSNEFIENVKVGTLICDKKTHDLWQCTNVIDGFMYSFKNTIPNKEPCVMSMVGITDNSIKDYVLAKRITI